METPESHEDKPDSSDTNPGMDVYAALGDPEPALGAPDFAVDEFAPELSEEKVVILQKQWEKFWKLRGRELPPQEVPDRLPEGTLFHQMGYDADNLRLILGSGVLSGELEFDDKKGVPEDAETHYCADFFQSMEARTVPEYIAFAREREAHGRMSVQRMERYALPDQRNSSLSLVITPDQPAMDELLTYSSTLRTLEESELRDWPIRFPRDRPEEKERHRAVLIGLPANYIREIIVGGLISGNPEKLAELKGLITETGLEIKIVDIDGQALMT